MFLNVKMFFIWQGIWHLEKKSSIPTYPEQNFEHETGNIKLFFWAYAIIFFINQNHGPACLFVLHHRPPPLPFPVRNVNQWFNVINVNINLVKCRTEAMKIQTPISVMPSSVDWRIPLWTPAADHSFWPAMVRILSFSAMCDYRIASR